MASTEREITLRGRFGGSVTLVRHPDGGGKVELRTERSGRDEWLDAAGTPRDDAHLGREGLGGAAYSLAGRIEVATAACPSSTDGDGRGRVLAEVTEDLERLADVAHDQEDAERLLEWRIATEPMRSEQVTDEARMRAGLLHRGWLRGAERLDER